MKVNKLLIPACILVAGLAASISFDTAYKSAEAAFETRELFSDVFERNEIGDEWIKVNDVNLKQHYSSMRFTPSEYSWTSDINFHEKLSGNYTITFELESSNVGSWFAIGLGSPYFNSGFASAKGGFVFCNDNLCNRLTAETGSLQANGVYPVSPFGTQIGVRRTVEIEVTYIDAYQSKLQCSVYENDSLLGKAFEEPMLYENLDGYFGFNTCLKDVEIFNLSIEKDGNLIYDDDFSESSVLYSTSGSFDSEWVANDFSEDDVKVGFINSLSPNDINSGVVYANPLRIPENKDLDIAFTIESEIQYSPMDFDVVSGIEIAKNTQDLHGFLFGIERLFLGYAFSIYGPDGSQIYVENTTKESSDLRVHLKVEIYLNGDVVFTADEISHKIHIDSFEGYIGLMNYAFKDGVEHGKGAYFKSFKLSKNDYYKRDNGDVFLNFNGTKETYFEDIGESAFDYWLPKSDYDIGTNVSLSKWNVKDKGDGKLEFNNSSNTSFFGPKGIYRDFVVKFDVKINSIDVPYASSLGLKFGNSRNGAFIENSKSIGIAFYNNKTNPYITNVDFAPGASSFFYDENGEQFDMFKDQNTFTLMFVAKDNTVSLHYLLEGEDEINLSKVRTKVICRENESTDGHLSIYGSNGLSFNIDNLSIINLDTEVSPTTYFGKSNYQETTRLDFTKNEDTSGLDLTNAQFNNNTLRINKDGKLSTSKLVTDGVLRLNIAHLEKELEIKQEQLQIRLINDINPRLVVKDSSLTKEFGLGSNFSFENSIFEIEKLDNNLVIHYVGGNEVLSKFEQNIINIPITVSNEPSKLEINAVNGLVQLNGFTFINLNKYSSFENRNYDPDKDFFDPWPVKEPIQGEKKGCGGSITTPSFIIMIISLLSLPIFLLMRRAKR